MKQSISKILIIRIAVVVTCINVLIALGFFTFSAQQAKQEFNLNIERQMQHLSGFFAQQLWIFNLSSAEQLASLTLNSSDVEGLRILDYGKNILIEKGSLNKAGVSYRQNELRFQEDNLVGYLEVSFNDTAWKSKQKDILITGICIVLTTILLTFLMVRFLLNRHLTKPLRDVQQDMNRLADGQFKSSSLVAKTEEIQSIINTFNKMASSLALREEQRDKAEEASGEFEIQLRQKYKMEAVGVMAGGMAHNFNNNLAIILGNLELSKMKLSPQGEIGEFLDNAQIAALRSRDLVKQIMTYSRKEAQSHASLQLALLLKETISLLKSTIPTSVNLQQEVSPDCEQAYIQADASQIQECLLNLCNNAVYAMEEQGELILRLERVELKQKDIPANHSCSPGDFLCLSVQDNGCGISVEIQEKIFDPFFTTKDLHQGTGMGLSTVHGIVEQHHGMITVESNVGLQTIFHLYFPVIDQSQNESVAVKVSELQRGSERILYVDDDKMVAHLSEQMLAEMGYQVTVMTDSLKALQLFSAAVDDFDLIITDQTMPDLTGQELIHEIKKLRPEIPTILCTGYSSKINGEKAHLAGISAFVMKPLEFVEFSKVIRDVLENPADLPATGVLK